MGMSRNLLAESVCPLDSLKPKKVSSLNVFKEISLLNQGRVKPVDTYAQTFLLRLSGKRHYQKESALEWFARFIFAPRNTFNDKVFLINNPEILETINIQPEKRRRYSYRQLESGYDKIKELARSIDKIEDNQRSVVEKEIMRVYNNVSFYIRLSGVFAYAFPHPDFTINNQEVRRLLHLPEKTTQFSFYDIFQQTDHLRDAASGLSQKDSGQWNESEHILARLINAMIFWTEHYSNCPLGIIPTVSHEDEHWLSPMDIINLDADVPAYQEEVTHIRNMVMHYWNNEQLEFDLAARALISSVTKRASPKELRAFKKTSLELMYTKLNCFFWAKILYGSAFFLTLFSFLSNRKFLYRGTLVVIAAGFIMHSFALILRVMIMSRPPVSNLFETFIFVGLIGVFLGLILEKINKNWLGNAVASTCGLVFLLISGKFASDGDTMQMLIAVLDSNFWLSTHVLTITIGYAGCCVAGLMGHIYIMQLLFQKENGKQHTITFKNMMGILGFGLTMTFLGTALGGIWADQSWGRFWGWDPKENGALLIVIWCAILFHARLGKLIHPLGTAAGCIIGLMVVMWAWFGVNLLSVGLHSYGFTSGIANALIAYVVSEFLFIAVTVIILGKRNVRI